MNRKYSARQIEEACRTDIRFMRTLGEENVITVTKREGLSFVSKSVSSIVRKVTTSMEENGIT